MSILVFDVETTGLPKKRNSPFTDFENWPYTVQISWLVYNYEKKEITGINDYIIKLPNDMEIPEDSIKIHGITNEMMNEQGQDIKKTLMKFKRDLSNSTFLVAHNLEFDTSIASVELLRNGLRNAIYYYRGQKCCTMKGTKRLFRNKWPKLVDLHYKLFRKKPKNLHNSLIDVFVCFRCYCQYYYDFDPVKDKTHFKEDHPKNIEFMKIYNKIL